MSVTYTVTDIVNTQKLIDYILVIEIIIRILSESE
jgi:hypothetical protein